MVNFRKCNYQVYLLLTSLFIQDCSKDLNWSDFDDSYQYYQTELRIEGMLSHSDFSQSVIRIDRTISLDNSTLFNGLDDNGDWVSFSDINNNGQWDPGEPLNDDIGVPDSDSDSDLPPRGRGNGLPDSGEPHVDDLLEILPNIQDSTFQSIILRESTSQDFIAEFEWSNRAGTVVVSFEDFDIHSATSSEVILSYSYGGYIPLPEFSEVTLQIGTMYTLELTDSLGNTISSNTSLPGQPFNIFWNGGAWSYDTLMVSKGNPNVMTWNTPSGFVYCGMTILEPFNSELKVSDELKYQAMLPSFREDFKELNVGTYRICLATYSQEYGNYLYSKLPLQSGEVSSWRDTDGDIILGALGSKAEIEFYLKLGD